MSILLSIVVSLIFLIASPYIAKILNLYDIPDSNRKYHEKKTPLTGGIIIFFTLFFFISYEYGFENIFDNNNTISIKQNFLIFFGFIIFFFVGLLDDKINLNANLKIITFILLIFIVILFDENLLIFNIKLSFLNSTFSIGNFSYLWTIICFLLFINAINMFDGINLQVGVYSLFCFLYILVFFDLFNKISIIMIISLIGFLYLNSMSKSFLGNGGSYALGFLISCMFIKIYNLENNVSADEIVLIMIIPGIDLMRLFFYRLYNKRHPFSPDRKHLHHYLQERYNANKAFLILFVLIWLPIVLGKVLNLFLPFIIFQIIFYFYLVYFFSKLKIN